MYLRIGSPEWYKLRQSIVNHLSSLTKPGDRGLKDRLADLIPSAYIGLPSFSHENLQSRYSTDKAMVGYCVRRFTTAGCKIPACKACHDFPAPNTTEWGELDECLLNELYRVRGLKRIDISKITYCKAHFVSKSCDLGNCCPYSHYRYTTTYDEMEFNRQIRDEVPYLADTLDECIKYIDAVAPPSMEI